VGARRPVIAGDTAYVVFMYDKVGLSESTLFAFDRGTGAQRWSYTIPHIGNEPVVASGVIYWSSFEGSVHAIDRQGSVLWKAPGTDAGIGVPVVDAGHRLFVSEIAGGAKYTWCLDRTTGATLWRFEHGGHTYRLCHSDDRLYHTSVMSHDIDTPPRCSFLCLSAVDGRVQWSVPGREYLFNPIVIDERVHVCSHRTLYVHTAVSGERLGKQDLGPESETTTVAPSTQPEQVIVWGSRTATGGDWIAGYALEQARRWFGPSRLGYRRLWRLDEPRRLCDAPIAVSADRLACVTHDGVVQTIASATGERLSELKLKTQPNEFGGLACTGEALLAAHGRDVFAFSLES
jgi:outer membrane protein assembly factor BamB